MKNIKIILGVILVFMSILSIKDYVLMDNRWSEYQKGIVFGKFILCCIGIFLMYVGLRKKKIHRKI